MRRNLKPLLCLTAAATAAFASTNAKADVFQGVYTFNQTTETTGSVAPTAGSTSATSYSKISFGNFSRNNLVSRDPTGAGYASSGFTTSSTYNSNFTTSDSYLFFTVTADAGNTFTADSLNFSLLREKAGPQAVQIAYDYTTASGGSTVTRGLLGPVISLTSNQDQTFSDTRNFSTPSDLTSLVVYFYGYDSKNSGTNNRLQFTNTLTFKGKSKAPEPTAAVLAVIGAGGLLMRRSRRPSEVPAV